MKMKLTKLSYFTLGHTLGDHSYNHMHHNSPGGEFSGAYDPHGIDRDVSMFGERNFRDLRKIMNIFEMDDNIKWKVRIGLNITF